MLATDLSLLDWFASATVLSTLPAVVAVAVRSLGGRVVE
jgi:hypothetical protein